MALGTCLADLLARRVISQERHDALRPIYDEWVTQFEGRGYGRAAAESLATERALQAFDDDLLRRKRQALLQQKAQGAWLARRQLDARESGAFDAVAAHEEIVAMDGQRHAIRRQALGMMSGLLARHRRNALGQVRAADDLDEVVDELFGAGGDNVNAREIADAWKRTGEWLRQRFNAAGGHIGKLEGWALPQKHDARQVREAGFEAWREALLPLLDRSKMLDRESGLPLNDLKLDAILRDMWEAIATEGWSRANPGGRGAGALGNGRAHHRVLHFRDADAWRAYSQSFGGGTTAFDAMLGHIEGMARDIAAMEAMGPNPGATLAWQQDWLSKSATESFDRKAIDGEFGARRQLGRLFDEYFGANTRVENRRVALGFSVLRAQQVAAKLGSAVLSVGGDFGTTLLTAGFNGVPPMRTIARYLKLLKPGSLDDRELAARLGVVSEEWASLSAAQARYTGEELTHEFSRRTAEFVLRASGLSRHTEAAQMAFGMEMLATLVHARGRSFEALDPALQRALQRYGMSSGDWDRLRSTPTRDERGSAWFFPEDIAEHAGQDMADRVYRMIATETDFAIPMPDLRTRAFINGLLPRGNWLGEIGRSAFLFKGFPLSIINMHGRRLLAQPGMGRKFAYGTALVGLTTAGGALSVQLKEIAAGRDPRDMSDKGFLAEAAFQGGGLGIFGDLVRSSETRIGGGIAGALAGPAAQLVENAWNATGGNLAPALDDDPETEPEWAKDAWKLAKSEIPGASLWYTRLAYERLLSDSIAEWANPGQAEAYRRMEQRAQERGTSFWLPPGQGFAGARGIDWGNALGDPTATENVAREEVEALRGEIADMAEAAPANP